jgi:hypothetical protein
MDPPSQGSPPSHRDNPHQRVGQPTYAVVSNSTQYVNCSPTKDVPSTPCFVQALEQSHSREATNLDLLNHPFPCHLSIHDKFIPMAVFDSTLVPLFVVEDFVQMIHKVMPQRRWPNNNWFAKLLPNPFPNHSLFSMKLVIVVCTFDVTTSSKTFGFTSPVQDMLVYENLLFRVCVVVAHKYRALPLSVS